MWKCRTRTASNLLMGDLLAQLLSNGWFVGTPIKQWQFVVKEIGQK